MPFQTSETSIEISIKPASQLSIIFVTIPEKTAFDISYASSGGGCSWQLQAYSELKNHVDIIIAPGNHDFLSPDSRDVFLQSEFSLRKYPFIVDIDGASIIIENSIETFWLTSKNTFDLAKLTEQEIVIIARHNPPIIEFSNIVNSKSGMSNNLENIEDLIKNFENNKSYIWVIGDSGAFPDMPRIMCLSYKNHKFILNGLGQTNGDSVLIYNNNQIYEFKL